MGKDRVREQKIQQLQNSIKALESQFRGSNSDIRLLALRQKLFKLQNPEETITLAELKQQVSEECGMLARVQTQDCDTCPVSRLAKKKERVLQEIINRANRPPAQSVGLNNKHASIQVKIDELAKCCPKCPHTTRALGNWFSKRH